MIVRKRALLLAFLITNMHFYISADEPDFLGPLHSKLQQSYKKLPIMNLHLTQDPVRFSRLDLASSHTIINNLDFYAFRFKTPDKPGYLIWAFKKNKWKHQWYILPVEGEMQGFKTYAHKVSNKNGEDLYKKNDPFILQTLPAENFKPNAEYIIWFRFDPPVTTELTFALGMSGESEADSAKVLFPMLETKVFRTSPRKKRR